MWSGAERAFRTQRSDLREQNGNLWAQKRYLNAQRLYLREQAHIMETKHQASPPKHHYPKTLAAQALTRKTCATSAFSLTTQGGTLGSSHPRTYPHSYSATQGSSVGRSLSHSHGRKKKALKIPLASKASGRSFTFEQTVPAESVS